MRRLLIAILGICAMVAIGCAGDSEERASTPEPTPAYSFGNPRPCGLDWREVGCIVRSQWGDLEVEPDTFRTELRCQDFEGVEAQQCWCKLANVMLQEWEEDCIESSPCDLRRHPSLWLEHRCTNSDECLELDEHILWEDIQCWGEFSFRGGP